MGLKSRAVLRCRHGILLSGGGHDGSVKPARRMIASHPASIEINRYADLCHLPHNRGCSSCCPEIHSSLCKRDTFPAEHPPPSRIRSCRISNWPWLSSLSIKGGTLVCNLVPAGHLFALRRYSARCTPFQHPKAVSGYSAFQWPCRLQYSRAVIEAASTLNTASAASPGFRN